MKPILRHIANLWTLLEHPSCEGEWSLETKLRAIKDAGFDGVCWSPSDALTEGCEKFGLIYVGGMASADDGSFAATMQELRRAGATHVNVQLGHHDTTTEEALEMALALRSAAEPVGLLPAIESHRGTCTETPEKLYALAERYKAVTGDLLRVSWDFSHFAVVKHLVASEFATRLLTRPELIQHAQQFHFRPFNGHHAQVPITDSSGAVTHEVRDWLPFAEAVFRCWLEANGDTAREILVCPELGPTQGGYALSTFPNSWEDAKVLRGLIDDVWQRALNAGS